MKKKIGIGMLIVCIIFLALVWVEDDEETEEYKVQAVSNNLQDTSNWAIYWYLCGSDLESDGGYATTDLEELTDVQLPENVRVIIETGGASYWESDLVDSAKIQRFVYDSNGIELVDEQPSANMGKTETLVDFLKFANKNYPAEKKMMVFWNHGGGSVSGVAFDELYDYDALTLDEMHKAFASVWDLSVKEPPFEVVGFDACLMATVDVASTFSDIGKYLVASEETEPGGGWDYTGWVKALTQNTGMDGGALGKAICDTYYEACEEDWTEDEATLSVTNLSKVPALIEAYEAFGTEALSVACEDSGFFSRFSRVAASAENYGGNTREEGYTNMVDLGDLARQAKDLLPGITQGVLKALEDCVEYQVRGSYRSSGTGLSCYYSYNADLDDFEGYQAVGAGSAFKHYYAYGLTGSLEEDGMDYAQSAEIDIDDASDVLTLDGMNWDDMPLDIDEDGNSVLELGPQADSILAGIDFQLYYMDEENDMMLLLGTDNDLELDWENGIFKDNFRGVWGAIDDCIVYMELSYEGEDYNLYSVPVLLNGEEYNLQVVYDYLSKNWEILGARQGIDEYGMCDKEMRQLVPGDEITTIHYITSTSEDDDFEPVEMDTFTVTEDTYFDEAKLPDGAYIMMYEMYDFQGNTAYSDVARFDYIDGEIETAIFE